MFVSLSNLRGQLKYSANTVSNNQTVDTDSILKSNLL